MQVALTFDTEHPDRAGHEGGGIGRILDALAERAVRATFFVQGRWATSEPAALERMAADGHVIGNHSHHHIRFTGLTDDQIRGELDAAHDAIARVLGAEPSRWFRLPFHAGWDDPRVIGAVRSSGYTQVYRNCDPCDWQSDATEDRVLDDVAAAVREHPITIADLHSWPRVTAEALPTILQRLSEDGAELITVDEVPKELLAALCPGSIAPHAYGAPRRSTIGSFGRTRMRTNPPDRRRVGIENALDDVQVRMLTS